MTLPDFTQFYTTKLYNTDGITSSTTTGIELEDITGVDDVTRPGVICLGYSDPLLKENSEWIFYTSITPVPATDRGTLNGVTRAFDNSIVARSFSKNAVVAFIVSKYHMKAMRDAAETILSNNGWVAASATPWTYASVDGPMGVITVPTDATTYLSVGMKVKFTQTTVKYGFIHAITATTMTVYTGTDYTLTNAAITAPYYSTHKAPHGFPTSPAKWTASATDGSSRTQGSPVANTWYNLGSVSLSIPIGVWNVTYSVLGFAQNTAAATDHSLKITLSTANNSESDSTTTVWHSWRFASAAQFLNVHMSKSVLITTAAKTSYYLNTATGDVETTIGNSNSTIPLSIKAVCAYL